MKGYIWLFTALIFTFCVTAAMPAHASDIGSTTYDYYYTINIPSLDGLAPGATFDIEWLGAPLNAEGIGGGTNTSLTGSPQSGYNPYSDPWTSAYYFVNGSAVFDSEILVEFKNDGGQYLAYTFIEPDLFWATTGTNLPFPGGPDVFGLLKDEPTGLVWGSTQVGAMYGDPTRCAGCTITINAVPEVPINPGPGTTPEPGSLLLVGSGLAGLAGLVRRKITRA